MNRYRKRGGEIVRDENGESEFERRAVEKDCGRRNWYYWRNWVKGRGLNNKRWRIIFSHKWEKVYINPKIFSQKVSVL
jgi:hypothetical protein